MVATFFLYSYLHINVHIIGFPFVATRLWGQVHTDKNLCLSTYFEYTIESTCTLFTYSFDFSWSTCIYFYLSTIMST